jgi:hypothetical protein
METVLAYLKGVHPCERLCEGEVAYNSTNSENRKKDEGEYVVNNKLLPVLTFTDPTSDLV